MANRITVHAEIDRTMKNALQRKAAASKVTLSVIVRWALMAYLDKEAKARMKEE